MSGHCNDCGHDLCQCAETPGRITTAERTGLGIDLPGGRKVALYRGVPDGYFWQFTRPNPDGTPHYTNLAVSTEAFWAMRQLIDEATKARTELALAGGDDD